MQDEFTARWRAMGAPRNLTTPDLAQILNIHVVTWGRWSRRLPEADRPDWQRAGGRNFMVADYGLEWCRQFAAKHPEMMARRQLPENEQ